MSSLVFRCAIRGSLFNNLEDVRQERVRTIQDLADEYLISYKLRHPRSATFAEYALGHVKRLLGDKMLVDINEETVKEYQESRLREKTAPKSINEEIGFLLRIMDVPGDVLRVRLRKKKLLKAQRLAPMSVRRLGRRRRRASSKMPRRPVRRTFIRLSCWP